jgi:uncharacterized Zn finger protein (UPF0148 family)
MKLIIGVTLVFVGIQEIGRGKEGLGWGITIIGLLLLYLVKEDVKARTKQEQRAEREAEMESYRAKVARTFGDFRFDCSNCGANLTISLTKWKPGVRVRCPTCDNLARIDDEALDAWSALQPDEKESQPALTSGASLFNKTCYACGEPLTNPWEWHTVGGVGRRFHVRCLQVP